VIAKPHQSPASSDIVKGGGPPSQRAAMAKIFRVMVRVRDRVFHGSFRVRLCIVDRLGFSS